VTNQVRTVGAAEDRSQSPAYSVIVTSCTSENTLVVTFSSCLHPAAQQSAKATVQAGIVASLSLQKPAAFLHEEHEQTVVGYLNSISFHHFRSKNESSDISFLLVITRKSFHLHGKGRDLSQL